MSQTITAPPVPPAPPKRADGETLFWQRCDAFVQYVFDIGTYLATFITQVAAVVVEMTGYRDSTAASAATATTQAALATTNGATQVALATTQADLALQYAQQSQVEAPGAWAAGTSYTFPQVAVGSDGNTYRCLGTGVVGVDPIYTSPNWTKLTGAGGGSPVFNYETFGGF